MKKKVSILTLALALVMALASLGTVSATTVPGLGTAQDGNEVNIETAAMNLVKQQKAGRYKLMSTATLKKKIDKKSKIVIIDTMPAESYKARRIPGAKNATVGMEKISKSEKKALLKAVGKNKKKTIVVYCGFVKCPRSHYAAQYLVKKGYKHVYRQPGGIAAWIDAGYAYEGTAAGEAAE
jgi:rhodanese-related sulfurtransferase